MKALTVILVQSAFLLMTSDFTHAHGRLSWPPSRSSCWRRGYEGCRPQYDDNALNCGGFYRQWEVNAGKCGACGEPFDSASSHQGARPDAGVHRVLADGYRAGDVMDVEIVITASHEGWHEFRLCDVSTSSHLTHSCLDRNLLELADGRGTRWYDPKGSGSHWVRLQLPASLRCEHCVLQWKWNTGNRWGCDDTGSCCVGCGRQEQFYGCADVSIL